jgi:DNA-binding NarL/FixJ family response regulator
MMSIIRVLLVDDHPILRAGLRVLLSKAQDIEVVGDAETGEEALQMVQDLSPDVLLLDMEMPGKGGMEVAEELQRKGSFVNILALSAHNDRQYIQSVLRSGASGYLVKDEAPHEIIEAVRGVARGEQGWISRQITTRMFSWVQDKSMYGPRLTDREAQVLQQLVIAKTNQEIGLALGISEKTVEKHMETIFVKLGVSSRTEAAVWAAREELENKA